MLILQDISIKKSKIGSFDLPKSKKRLRNKSLKSAPNVLKTAVSDDENATISIHFGFETK